MTAKLKLRRQADGRIGFPGVVAYVLAAGPNEGLELLCPPSVEEHEDPSRRDKGFSRSTYPYRLLVKDVQEYERIRGLGYLYAPEHLGGGTVIDNRVAPKG